MWFGDLVTMPGSTTYGQRDLREHHRQGDRPDVSAGAPRPRLLARPSWRRVRRRPNGRRESDAPAARQSRSGREADETALAHVLALRGVADPTALLDTQAARTGNADRQAWSPFCSGAVSIDSAEGLPAG